ncbi:MAG: 1-deoxy-D-xylulose-5-phosphate synthase [Chlorobi bacterium OLB7]|nr:MAG: 1-deoxy-D-xylulose-5-phosphate synthase [Chlorobi bacterium OLB7]
MASSVQPLVNINNYPLLKLIDSPHDLRRLDPTQLRQVCADVRNYMIDVITQVGGHFWGRAWRGGADGGRPLRLQHPKG